MGSAMKKSKALGSVITVKGLSKSFGKLKAVDQLDFEVNEAEIFGFLGPNGAGKTTTIRMLTGLSQPTSGHARILGYDIIEETTSAKQFIGVVPDTSNLYDDLTAFENLLFMGKLYGVPAHKRKAKAKQLLHWFRLYHKRDQLFETFSRGMKRALTIAAALMHDPKILFLDEPTIGLDVLAARSLRTLIAQLKKQGITIFLMTHYMDEADLLCDRIAIIVSGKIITIGTPNELKAQLEKEAMVEFIFSAKVNKHLSALAALMPNIKIVELDPNQLRFYSDKANVIYSAVFDYFTKCGIEITSINTIRPTLEDAFIQITGLNPIVMSIENGPSSEITKEPQYW